VEGCPLLPRGTAERAQLASVYRRYREGIIGRIKANSLAWSGFYLRRALAADEMERLRREVEVVGAADGAVRPGSTLSHA